MAINDTPLAERFDAIKNLGPTVMYNYGSMVAKLKIVKNLAEAKQFEAIGAIDFDDFHERKIVGVGHAFNSLLDESRPVKRWEEHQ